MVVHEFMCADRYFDKQNNWLLFFVISVAVNAVFASLVPVEDEGLRANNNGLLKVTMRSMLAVSTGFVEQSPQFETFSALEEKVIDVQSRVLPQAHAEQFIHADLERNNKHDLAKIKEVLKNEVLKNDKTSFSNVEDNSEKNAEEILENSNQALEPAREIKPVEIKNENVSTPAASNSNQQSVETIQVDSLAADKTSGPLADPLSSISSLVGGQAGVERDTGFSQARHRHRYLPNYPQRARSLGQQGTVVLHAQVMPSGYSGQLSIVVSSGHELLDRAALAAVRKWQFVPAYAEGNPIAHWVSVPVRFALQ